MSKLTLSVDDRVVSQAKRYAKRCGVSISKLVESYLSAVTGPLSAADTPVLRLVRGSLREDGTQAYRKHLASKYR
ncbi:MAG TPA: DUF6364 family protein [Bryobacteraceae bacterium]